MSDAKPPSSLAHDTSNVNWKLVAAPLLQLSSIWISPKSVLFVFHFWTTRWKTSDLPVATCKSLALWPCVACYYIRQVVWNDQSSLRKRRTLNIMPWSISQCLSFVPVWERRGDTELVRGGGLQRLWEEGGHRAWGRRKKESKKCELQKRINP